LRSVTIVQNTGNVQHKLFNDMSYTVQKHTLIVMFWWNVLPQPTALLN